MAQQQQGTFCRRVGHVEEGANPRKKGHRMEKESAQPSPSAASGVAAQILPRGVFDGGLERKTKCHLSLTGHGSRAFSLQLVVPDLMSRELGTIVQRRRCNARATSAHRWRQHRLYICFALGIDLLWILGTHG
jgi:hypothetical protein